MSLLRSIFTGCLLFGLGCHSISPVVQVEENSVSLATVTEVQQVTIDAAVIAKEHGDYDEALQLFKEVLQQNPVATDAFVGIGDIYVIIKIMVLNVKQQHKKDMIIVTNMEEVKDVII